MKHSLQFKKAKFLTGNRAFLLVFILMVTTIFTSCKKDTFPPCNDDIHGKNKTRVIVVHRGGSIQAAVDAAAPGSTILIEPGIYHGEVSISKADIQIIGMDCSPNEKVIIKNPGDEDCGIMVHKGGDGFVLKNVTVEGFSENGVYLEYVDHFLLSKITAIDCKEYGLYPVHCTNGVVEYCTASGSADTGIYVGQSSNVVMQ